jgi:hypothetical protein
VDAVPAAFVLASLLLLFTGPRSPRRYLRPDQPDRLSPTPPP